MLNNTPFRLTVLLYTLTSPFPNTNNHRFPHTSSLLKIRSTIQRWLNPTITRAYLLNSSAFDVQPTIRAPPGHYPRTALPGCVATARSASGHASGPSRIRAHMITAPHRVSQLSTPSRRASPRADQASTTPTAAGPTQSQTLTANRQ